MCRITSISSNKFSIYLILFDFDGANARESVQGSQEEKTKKKKKRKTKRHKTQRQMQCES